MDIRIIGILFCKISILRIHNHSVGHIKIVVRVRHRIAFQINIEVCALSTACSNILIERNTQNIYLRFFPSFHFLQPLSKQNNAQSSLKEVYKQKEKNASKKRDNLEIF